MSVSDVRVSRKRSSGLGNHALWYMGTNVSKKPASSFFGIRSLMKQVPPKGC